MLTLITLGLSVAEYLAPEGSRLWLGDASWAAAGLVAIVGVTGGARCAAPAARGRWRMLLMGCGVWMLGTVAWITFSLTAFPASPNLADGCWLAFAVFCVAALRRAEPRSRQSRVLLLEMGLLVVAVCALLTSQWWDQLRTSPQSTAAVITALAYPVVYVSAALVMLQTLAGDRMTLRGNIGPMAVLGGLIVEAIGFILWCPLLLAGSYTVGTNAVDALWSLGMVMVGLGAWKSRTTVQRPPPDPAAEGRSGILPALTLVTLVAVQLDWVNDGTLSGSQLPLIVGLGLVSISLLGRSEMLRREQTVLHAHLRERERELNQANQRLSRESRRDALTGLANRLHLDERFAELEARTPQPGRGYCLVLCDLDRFKDYNDACGHQAGDRVLRQVAALLEGETREGDQVYRYGGEELLLVLPEDDICTAEKIADRHRLNVQGAAIAHPANYPETVVTFSAGVAAAQPGERPEQVLLRADRALYQAKARGRNQVAAALADRAVAATT